MIKPTPYAIALVSLGIACKHQEPNYCADQLPDHNCMEIDAPATGSSDAGQCTTDQQCSGGTPVCNVSNSTCVQCTLGETAECSGTTPICGSDDACAACTSHTQCSSDVCLPDGSCGDGSNVAYVAATGSGSACTQAMPCATVAAGLATNRPYIKLSGTIDEQVSVASQDITMLADPGAILTSSSNGVILTVTGSSQLTIYDLEINGASGTTTGIGISIPVATTSSVTLTRTKVTQCQYIGISASSGTLSITQSTISGNTGGGIGLSSTAFKIENNFVLANGGGTSAYGGVKIDAITTTGMHEIDFNTITANVGPSTVDTGILCGTVTVPITIDSNIIYANAVSSGGQQLGGSTNCNATYSDIGPDGSAGSGNIDLDPVFVSAGTGNYAISADSPCIDAADPAATLDVDFYGDVRPYGSGRDIGADEYHP